MFPLDEPPSDEGDASLLDSVAVVVAASLVEPAPLSSWGSSPHPSANPIHTHRSVRHLAIEAIP
jgi:hypothetical protein